VSNIPWQKAEIPGPKRARPLQRPEVLASLIEKSKRTILIVGHRASDIDIGDKKLIDYAIDLANAKDIAVVATAHSIKEFFNRGFRGATSMPLMDIANRLSDSGWNGLDDAGDYDLAIFIGIPYYMAWLVLSGLKHMSSHLQTVSLDGQYQPNASWSTPNISPLELQEFLDILLERIEEKQ
jgi:acetyl-CoA decarbonylase/synthase complex subunit epsilon